MRPEMIIGIDSQLPAAEPTSLECALGRRNELSDELRQWEEIGCDCCPCNIVDFGQATTQ